jgi:hypothetical protein
MVNYKLITIFDDTKTNTSDINMNRKYELPSTSTHQDDKFNFDSYVNTNPNRTMFKLHAVPIDMDENNSLINDNRNYRISNRAQSASSPLSRYNNSNNNNIKRERSKSPTMLVDLVINTPKSDIKIQRKCKSYEVSLFFFRFLL